MRSRIRRTAGAVLLAIVLAAPAGALPVVLELLVVAPTPGTLLPGSSIFLDLMVSGLSDPPPPGDGSPSLMAFELDITYDESVLDFVSLTFVAFPSGTSLVNGSNEPCTFANLDGFCHVVLDSDSSSGLVELAAASLIDPLDVNDNQPASGLIASLEFVAQSAGTSAFTFTQTALSGTTMGTTLGSLAASPIQTTSVTVLTPEPASAVLLGLGLTAMARRRRFLRNR